MSLTGDGDAIDQATALRRRREAAEKFREQLVWGAPSNADESGLQRLRAQLRDQKLAVKLFLRHQLHAKLYLVHRADPINPIVGFLGSSNLTLAGLAKQGELNVDVLDHDACEKLQHWFDARWRDNRCLDISDELAEIIDGSWARERPIPPYLIYLKIAYHLSQEARAGLAEFSVPPEFRGQLFQYQEAAVRIAARHLNQRGGVVMGDAVGLGKTLMATALARIFEDDQGTETLIICPPNLVSMWREYVHRYRLRAEIVPLSRVQSTLPDLSRYRVVIIDESHNLRNREGQRYKAIREYVERNESKCILLSATPYNKSFLDLSAQLRLFVPEDENLGVRPEEAIREIGELEFTRRHQCQPATLAAFDKSDHADDWRELMRRYLVRRTRSFIQENYGLDEEETGRRYLPLADGRPYYFPVRTPRTVTFEIDDTDPADQYARLYSPRVVGVVDGLTLPRYGLGQYRAGRPVPPPTKDEAAQLDALGRAGERLRGFSRTNLFKRLESGGPAFIRSIERHVLRNFVFLHAIEHGLPLPLGTQDPALLDTDTTDADAEAVAARVTLEEAGEGDGTEDESAAEGAGQRDEEWFRREAARVYERYRGGYGSRFRWLRPSLFTERLRVDLLADARALLGVLREFGEWDASRDAKLAALTAVLIDQHPDEKVLVFSQFADTVSYLVEQLRLRGLEAVEGVTGGSADPTALARRFSPESNDVRRRVAREDQIRVLVSTDVLSEGQNLQDCAIVVNYDLPWAIIRLIQRAGRVDRIGQRSPEIICYSYLPAEGVDAVLRLRQRLRRRLRENAEVVGTDEIFFPGEEDEARLVDLYHERAGVLDGDDDGEVDLASRAYQIWKNALDRDPSLARAVERLPDVVYSTRAYTPAVFPEGVLVYVRTGDDTDALAWIGRDGQPVTQSQSAILQAAACEPGTAALPRDPQHHELVREGLVQLAAEQRNAGGQLGRPNGARRRTVAGALDGGGVGGTAPGGTVGGLATMPDRACARADRSAGLRGEHEIAADHAGHGAAAVHGGAGLRRWR